MAGKGSRSVLHMVVGNPGTGGRWRWRCAAAAALAALAAVGPAAAEDITAGVKVAVLYNFLKLTTWPAERVESPEGPLRVCTLPGDTLAPLLQKSLDGRKADAYLVQTGQATDGVGASGVNGADEAWSLESCHLVFLGAAFEPRYPELMSRLAGKGVLVVDEGARFSWPNGMIRLFFNEGRIAFELNLAAAEKSGLALDPRLIRLAKIATP